MRGDAVRVMLVAVLATGMMATALAGVAEAPSGVRVPAVPVTELPAEHSDLVTVLPGDHFWKISQRRLEQTSPSAPVGPYWRQVVEVNLDNIRSGDPDLIFPGEVVELP